MPKKTTAESEPQLTHPAREAIRGYMLSLIVLPGLVSLVLSFFLGYFINDIAKAKAQNDAFAEASAEVFDLIKLTADSRAKLNSLTESQDEIRITIEAAQPKIESTIRRTDKLKEQLDIVDSQIGKLIKNPEPTLKALKQLDEYIKAFGVAADIGDLKSSAVRFWAVVDSSGKQVTTSHDSIEVAPTSSPGLYRVDVPFSPSPGDCWQISCDVGFGHVSAAPSDSGQVLSIQTYNTSGNGLISQSRGFRLALIGTKTGSGQN